ncbi:hypothetical protein NW753_008876 [Fusarium oxysporum]|nr:hypothetical protein NW753_008876 [Fusarium oxysporum]KAJ4105828.1 hypothetical protein NW769_009230 [Fusarium oxysporum]
MPFQGFFSSAASRSEDLNPTLKKTLHHAESGRTIADPEHHFHMHNIQDRYFIMQSFKDLKLWYVEHSTGLVNGNSSHQFLKAPRRINPPSSAQFVSTRRH